MTNKTIAAVLLSLVPLLAGAAGGESVPLQAAHNDLADKASCSGVPACSSTIASAVTRPPSCVTSGWAMTWA